MNKTHIRFIKDLESKPNNIQYGKDFDSHNLIALPVLTVMSSEYYPAFIKDNYEFVVPSRWEGKCKACNGAILTIVVWNNRNCRRGSGNADIMAQRVKRYTKIYLDKVGMSSIRIPKPNEPTKVITKYTAQGALFVIGLQEPKYSNHFDGQFNVITSTAKPYKQYRGAKKYGYSKVIYKKHIIYLHEAKNNQR